MQKIDELAKNIYLDLALFKTFLHTYILTSKNFKKPGYNLFRQEGVHILTQCYIDSKYWAKFNTYYLEALPINLIPYDIVDDTLAELLNDSFMDGMHDQPQRLHLICFNILVSGSEEHKSVESVLRLAHDLQPLLDQARGAGGSNSNLNPPKVLNLFTKVENREGVLDGLFKKYDRKETKGTDLLKPLKNKG